jgi:DNA repair photolyase
VVRASQQKRQQVRWETADGAAEPALFGTPEERIRHPEFRDLEFIHVRSKSIINEVPAVSRVPFRYTINVYRGCSHACTYCAAGDTPVLMADGRTKPLADIRPGDRVYGTSRRGAYRRYTPTEVLDHWSTVKRAYRVVLEDGTELITSGDHRFLSDRGWKYVTGAEQGRHRRPHLTTNNALMGVGHFAEGPKDSAAYRRGYLCGMIRGDATLRCYTYERPGRRPHHVHQFRLALVDEEALTRVRRYFRDYALEFELTLFQPAEGNRKALYQLRTGHAEVVHFVRELIEWPREPCDEWTRGFLAGVFDAEGSCSASALRFSNSDDEILDRITAGLGRSGFSSVLEDHGRNRVRVIRLTGGLKERLRFFLMTDPAITRKRVIDDIAIKSDARLRVTSIEPLGFDMPMYDITTGTGDFIANGVVSHNCFARPTHEYLDLDAGRDFERVIVVKTNAVELLRHELRPSRWAGEHIAMGTNTDPYQRAEGRYRLTRGVIEVLTEHANPFSILTKSSLVLRDLDLLRAAHERTDIAVNFSIGTLDRDVWRETEPGTPNPHSRVEALATLREAGIHAGVLIAPVIPGVSDAPEQLDEVVRACVDAGASSISPIVLHLRPGVKEQFMPWLAHTRPDLLERYRRLYPRSYAPKVEQQRISRLVRDLVSRHSGGRLGRTSSGEARRVGTAASSSRRPAGSQRPASPSGDRAPREEAPEQAAAEEPPARQLDLGI